MKLLLPLAALAALIVPAGIASAAAVVTNVPTYAVCEAADCSSVVTARVAESPAPTGTLALNVPTWVVCATVDCASLVRAHAAGVQAPLVFCMSLDCGPAGVAYRVLRVAGYDPSEPVSTSPGDFRILLLPALCTGVECLPVPEVPSVRILVVPTLCTGEDCGALAVVEDVLANGSDAFFG